MKWHILTDEEALKFDLTGQQKAHRAASSMPPHCLCGRFAKFVRYVPYTMPHGESVTTVQCSRCGEVDIR